MKPKPNLRLSFLFIAALLVATAFFTANAWTQQSTQERQPWEVQMAPNAQANSTITIQNQCQQTHSFNVIQQQTPFLQLLAALLVNVAGNSSYQLPVRFNTNGLNAGQYQGTVIVKCETCSKEKTCKQDREILPLRLTVVENPQAQPTPTPTAPPSATPQLTPTPASTPTQTPTPVPIPTLVPPPTPTPSPGGHPPPAPTPHTSPSPCASPPAPTPYSVKDLSTLSESDTAHCVATGVNDGGNVVGACSPSYFGKSGGAWHAFRTEPGAVITKEDELAFPLGISGGSSFATAVNGKGHVVGFRAPTGSSDDKAFWHDGGKKAKMINLHLSTAKFTTSRAFAINIHDDVVGAAYSPALGPLTFGVTFFPGHAVIWSGADPKSMKDLNDDLDAIVKADWILNAAFGIDDDGDIVGRAYNKKLKKYHAFLLKAVGVKFFDLGALKEYVTDSSTAYAINECGDKAPAIDRVVGYTYTKKDSHYGFIWTEAAGLMDMGTLSGYSESYAKAINKKGEVVGAVGDLHTSIVFDFLTCFGTCFTKGDSGDAYSHGVWYNGTELKDLNKLIPAYPGYEIEVANGINDKGQIVGSAFYKPPTYKSGGLYAKAVLLTPAGLTLPGPVKTTTTTSAACPLSIPSGGYIFDNWNVCGAKNGPTKDTAFTIDAPYLITFVATYHWNYGKGALPTKGVSLKDSSGKVYGPWPVITSAGSGGAANVNWECHPGITLPAGTYTVIDPDPATWSQNDGSGNSGFARVAGSTTKK